MASSIGIIGAGIFGVTAAIALRRRGHNVTLLDPGPIPHPDASSTDITKAIRPDYGADDSYMDLMLEALDGWDRWNAEWKAPLYHESGFLLMRRGTMAPGEFEYESFERLHRRGLNPQRLDGVALRERFPAWAGQYDDGYFNPRAGYAESGNVVTRLAATARAAGVVVREGARLGALSRFGDRVTGIRTADDEALAFDTTLVAAGAWTPLIVPGCDDRMWAVAQSVMHFRPVDPQRFRPPLFSTWAADISRTGWYGFPALADGTLKVANHGVGMRTRADAPRRIPDGTEATFRAFLRETFPQVADAPLIGSRVCLYCDTWDGDFYIDHVPGVPGLMVASGGAGHAFKFAPVLGDIIANAMEGKPDPRAARFRWRDPGARRTEDARNA